MKQLPEIDRLIARHTAAQLSNEGDLYPYHNDDESLSIAIMSNIDRPSVGVNTFVTVGLSDIPIMYFGREVNVEIVASGYSRFTLLPNIVASIALDQMSGRIECFHGNVVESVIEQYYPNSEMKHIFLNYPFIISGFNSVEISGRRVNWLLAMPISAKEFELWRDHGYSALETVLEDQKIDVLDVFRTSTL